MEGHVPAAARGVQVMGAEAIQMQHLDGCRELWIDGLPAPAPPRMHAHLLPSSSTLIGCSCALSTYSSTLHAEPPTRIPGT